MDNKTIEDFFKDVGFVPPTSSFDFFNNDLVIDTFGEESDEKEENLPSSRGLGAYFNRTVPPDVGFKRPIKYNIENKNKAYTKKDLKALWSVSDEGESIVDKEVELSFPKEGDGKCEMEIQCPVKSLKSGEEIKLESDTMIENVIYKKGQILRIQEIEAEIVNGEVPDNKIFTNDGNLLTGKPAIKFEKLINTEIIPILQRVKDADNQYLIKAFQSDNVSTPDIKPGKANGTYILTTDENPPRQWEFNIQTKRMRRIF